MADSQEHTLVVAPNYARALAICSKLEGINTPVSAMGATYGLSVDRIKFYDYDHARKIWPKEELEIWTENLRTRLKKPGTVQFIYGDDT